MGRPHMTDSVGEVPAARSANGPRLHTCCTAPTATTDSRTDRSSLRTCWSCTRRTPRVRQLWTGHPQVTRRQPIQPKPAPDRHRERSAAGSAIGRPGGTCAKPSVRRTAPERTTQAPGGTPVVGQAVPLSAPPVTCVRGLVVIDTVGDPPVLDSGVVSPGGQHHPRPEPLPCEGRGHDGGC